MRKILETIESFIAEQTALRERTVNLLPCAKTVAKHGLLTSIRCIDAEIVRLNVIRDTVLKTLSDERERIIKIMGVN